MNKEDSLQFVHERLRHNHSTLLNREIRLTDQPRVTRRLVVEVGKGEAHMFERVDRSFVLRCTGGSVWITHDGDPKDIILASGEEYRAQREDAMHVFALQPSVLEIEFEDEVTQH